MWADEGQVYQFKRCSFCYINDDTGKVQQDKFFVIKNDFHVKREFVSSFPKPNIICHVLMIFNVIP